MLHLAKYYEKNVKAKAPLSTVRSKSNCAPGILKQERYPVFEKSITKYFELSILCEEQ